MGKHGTVVIADLDDTVLTVNSYHLVLPVAARYCLAPSFRRVALGLQLAAVILLRRLGLRNRVQMKRVVQRICVAALVPSEKRLEELLILLEEKTNSAVLGFLAAAKGNGARLVLSTAALPEYAEALSLRLGFDHVVATSRASERPWVENLGDNKRQRTLALLETHGLDSLRRVFLGDHLDDVPLAKACHSVLWVGSGPLDTRQAECPEASRFDTQTAGEVFRAASE